MYSFPPEKVLKIRHFRNCSYTKMTAPFSLLTLFTRRESDPGAMEWYRGPKITRCLFSMSSCLIVRSSCQFVMSSCLPVVHSCRFVMLSCVQNKQRRRQRKGQRIIFHPYTAAQVLGLPQQRGYPSTRTFLLVLTQLVYKAGMS